MILTTADNIDNDWARSVVAASKCERDLKGIDKRTRGKREGTGEFHKQTTPSSRVSKKLSSKPSPTERAIVVKATSSSLLVNISD